MVRPDEEGHQSLDSPTRSVPDEETTCDEGKGSLSWKSTAVELDLVVVMLRVCFFALVHFLNLFCFK